MIKFLLFISIFLVCSQLKAQYKIDEFGDVSIADLEMKECSFEKDANAMYLFSHGKIYRHDPYEVSFEVHKRIKIFNDKGKAEANIRLEFFGNKRNGFEEISGLQAQTINLVDGKVEITKIDKKAVYNENLDLLKSAKTFSFPNVKDGSIIEYKYSIRTAYLPPWNFQSNIPVRYSELTTDFPDSFNFTILSHGLSNLVKNTKVKKGRGLDDDVINTRGMAEIPSLVSEPFMSSRVDNLVSISHYPSRSDNTWEKIYTDLLEDEDFGSQFGKKLNGEKVLISKAITLKNDADKIAFLFNEVRNSMKWNGTNSCYADDGVTKSWEKKIGNSAEINFILYRLLKESGIKVYPMLVSTKEHGIFNKNIPRLGQLDKTIAYIPIDSNSAYYLDASDKYQTFNSIPEFLLNKNGFCVNKSTKKPEFVFIQKTSPVRNSIFIKAQISSNGQLKGTVITSNQDYFKLELTKLYKKEGEEKFKDYLRNNDPNIKITS
ncbi:MAG: hypothetical protein JWQ25_2831, partial [Daejeonella sp.]|nr:hypothetical protein [Daejeonella sp.]